MWISVMDEDGPVFSNLDVRQDVRFMTVRNLQKTFVDSHPYLKDKSFGADDDLLMVLIGPGPTDFEVVLGLHKDEHQQQTMALVQTAVRQGLENGTRLLDLDKLVSQAKANLKKRD